MWHEAPLNGHKFNVWSNFDILDGMNKIINLKCRIDTNKELEYYKAGGILNYVLNEIISEAA